MTNIQETLNLAVQRHRAGNMPGAETLYRQILATQPNHPDALHLLGVLASQTGRSDMAIEFIRRAIAQNPQAYQFHLNLGVALNECGRTDEALSSLNRALSIKPDEARVLCNLSFAWWKAGHPKEAISAARRALAIIPDYPEAHNNLGNALQAIGQTDQAVVHFRKALAKQPNIAETHANLASALIACGKLDEAIASARRAMALKPSLAIAHNNLGIALVKAGRAEEAVAPLRQAVALRPGYADAYYNLGAALAQSFDYESAKAAWEQAIKLQPDHSIADSNRFFVMHFDPRETSQSILREHKIWNQRHAEPLAGEIKPHTNERSANRRLRIGYVSQDFRDHVVGWSMIQLLENHDHEKFEIFCYGDNAVSDGTTERLRLKVDHWRNITDAEDPDAAEMIRSDGIDILVDLAGHTVGNRLLIFARKPAPVQVTYLGYPGTTGLSAIDYRFSDPYLDPPDTDLSSYCEQTIRLPRTYWCYTCANPAPDVGPAPAIANGFVTFGCLNNFSKVTPEAIEIWMKLLENVSDSHLLLHCDSEIQRQKARDCAAKHGIAPERLEFVGRRRWAEYIQTYNRIDVALDTFPYGGAISTCDSLWMGVPVVTLAGHTVAGRGGSSILNNIGLPELVARTAEHYIAIALEWRKWIELRPTLRQKMQSSPLMDARAFARDVEAAYRQMWTTFCTK